MGKPPTVPTRPGGHERFIRRARAFAFGMQAALREGHPDLALSAAAHCVIAACDAILAKKTGRRSIARDHSSVAGLIEGLPLPGVAQKARQVEFVLSLKSAGEYEERDLSAEEVEKAVAMAKRVLEWVEAALER